MTDKVYQRQLEKFGIESVQIVDGDPRQKRLQESLDIHRGVVRALMDSIEGRQWLYSKLDLCAVFTAPFAGEKPITNAFLSGIQAVGQNLLDDIMKAAPQNFSLMMEEEAARNLNSASQGHPTTPPHPSA